jgi:hypothetical protein
MQIRGAATSSLLRRVGEFRLRRNDAKEKTTKRRKNDRRRRDPTTMRHRRNGER